MKVKCSIKFDAAKDAGAINGDMEIVKFWCKRSPELRPCGMVHGWVDKKRTCLRCKHLIQVVNEE